ncbi:uncharacterized protein LOC112091196 isoform X2 [Morus notabilis]|nr:uncharacterized protein LOC112091196 isoform X2 [Morus notabilis]
MLRPRFPPVYRESQMPDVSAISEVVVIVNDSWKVGDLVDWWQDGCYWSGRIAEVLEDGKYQMDLLPPPLGEGLSYEVCSKDLRPSLDWSLKSGWTVSAPMDSDNGQRCARIVNPANKGNTSSFKTRKASENRDRVQGKAGSSQSSVPSRGSARSPKPSNKLEQMRKLTLGAMAADKEMHTPATYMDLDMLNGGTWESSCSDSDESESSGIIGDETGASVSAFTSHVSSSSSEPPDKMEETKKRPLCAMEEKENTQGTKTESDMENDSIGKTICSDNDSNSDVKAGSTDVGEMMLEKDRLEGGSSKKMKTDVNIPLNLMFSNTIEAAVLDLEELVNRVKWMKSLLEIATSSSNTTRPPWKFLGHLASSAPK